ncbi:MAG: ABC transporter substrate-binding protein [Rouxiella badensis]|uniref:ABC transporter substrate-binding protein n=1 Tax=Rouxiella badensis TaxID=1646377 RepID=A0A1X0WFE5_9GAMM|nr:ABC transporter substrate-binding protein [Rouxiella badensis]ORJ25507.1 ABC transporter substrate-binding protein [Rouxiella badensis]QOI54989.1 ABC transporter substrate-binding protein [Rouxiella badensis subsp. acadiensis]WAT03944.1 ABC transporter substrate-binding protein [Rouxiella badensis]
MKLLKKLLLPLVIAASTQSVWAADQNVPFSSSLHVSADSALKSKLPEDILKRGYIVAGTNPNTPPTTFYMADNKTLAGREIDVMSAIAERLGVAVQWRDTGGFDNIIPGLKSGRYDVALSNINATKARLSQVDFIGYFDASRLGIISRKDENIAPFTSLQDVCGKQVGAGAGTTQLLRLQEATQKCVADGKPGITIATFPDRPAGVQAVVSGRVAMFFGPYEGLTYQVSKVPVLTMSGQITVNDAPVSIAFPKGSPLEDAVQAALNSLIKDGSYQKILDKWNIGYGAMKEAKRNEEIF